MATSASVGKLSRLELDLIISALAAFRAVKKRAVSSESNAAIVLIRKDELACVDALAARLMSQEFVF
jgi:hypothetical protein